MINANRVYLYMFAHHCIWVFAHALYKYVKLSSVATFAAPCTACGMWSGHSRCGENLLLELLALIHCNRACMGGLSCSCEYACVNSGACETGDQFKLSARTIQQVVAITLECESAQGDGVGLASMGV